MELISAPPYLLSWLGIRQKARLNVYCNYHNCLINYSQKVILSFSWIFGPEVKILSYYLQG